MSGSVTGSIGDFDVSRESGELDFSWVAGSRARYSLGGCSKISVAIVSLRVRSREDPLLATELGIDLVSERGGGGGIVSVSLLCILDVLAKESPAGRPGRDPDDWVDNDMSLSSRSYH